MEGSAGARKLWAQGGNKEPMKPGFYWVFRRLMWPRGPCPPGTWDLRSQRKHRAMNLASVLRGLQLRP